MASASTAARSADVCWRMSTQYSSRSIIRDSASGIEADEVLPAVTISSATFACGAPSLRAIASMMRRLAWCGTNAVSSDGSIPAAAQASFAIGCSAVVAHRNTAWPSWWMNELRSLT